MREGRPIVAPKENDAMSLPLTKPATIVRHEVDPCAVAASVAHAIAGLERRRAADLEANAAGAAPGAPPADPSRIHARYDRLVARERDHYSTARVLQRISAQGGSKRFTLAYGPQADTDDSEGTGPFATLSEATAWFANHGR